MNWLTRPNRFHADVLASCLRCEIDKLIRVLNSIEQARDYREEYICESIKLVEVGLRSIRRSIKDN